MRFQWTKIALASALLLALPAVSFAHGGVYRGPGDTVPPGGGGGDGSGGRGSGGPPTGDPGAPSEPGVPGRPTGGTPTPPTGGSRGGGRIGGTSGPRGVQIGEDLDSWLYWWEFNKAPFLQLKRRIWSGTATTGEADIHVGRGEQRTTSQTLRPSASDLRTRVVPALKHALMDPSSNRDIVSSALIALARIGKDPAILPLLTRFLDSKDQEKQESAALALGISALPEALDDLFALAADSRRGRDLVGKPSGVGFRTRSFACYGCGLIAHETKSASIKRRVFEAMQALLDPQRNSRRDVRVAALHAIRLLRPSDGEAGLRLRDDAVRFLLTFVDRPNREVFAQVRAHAYSALAHLLGRSAGHDAVRARVLAAVRNKRERPWIHQSAILALGEMAAPEDVEASAAIRTYLLEGKDQQAKRFCAIALGQIGGTANETFLRKRMLRAQSTVKPWLALGLGLASDTNRLETSSVVDVRAAYRDSKAPLPTSGLAMALGIFGDKDSEDVILQRMLEFKNNDEAAGYHAIALGLIGHSYAIADINQLLDKASRRETLLTQCAIALGLLGDKGIGLKLVSRLADDNSVAVSSALAQALGFIGDRRSIDSLVSMLADKQQKDIPRAFAAVALGLIGDKEALPWSSKIAVNINYRANVETLTGNSTGVLDIL